MNKNIEKTVHTAQKTEISKEKKNVDISKKCHKIVKEMSLRQLKRKGDY